ncbi:MBL fold metallo-hydrolase [Aliarcobacter butzleri]|uniref:MBL fold metallo-hydrolase n=1 Tax=Aliarcobacter butzleri TaxID=28197 RepID=UPI00263E22F4|nr:MBL fold metallo-hydrolase [Aliarcobacter butzleri]MDN5078308.1 MBL fold metallo-hydrolase [Aliarcobacter butzleri]MDN5119667.1 MBL fold metallo-hydrolase [Aliarcobacter butzleri]
MDTSSIKIITCNQNSMGINSYVIIFQDYSIVIDPNNFDEIEKALNGTKFEYIFLTHEHFDHIMSVDKLREKYQVKVIAQKFTNKNIQASSKNLSKFSEIIFDFMKKTSTSKIEEFSINCSDIEYDDSYILDWHGQTFFFKHTPGHSEGSSCIYVNNYLFTGDSLFEAVDTSFLGGRRAKIDYLNITMPFFYSLDKKMQVFAGHYDSFVLEDKLCAKEKAIEIYNNRVSHSNCYMNYNEFIELIEKNDFIVRNNSIFIIVNQNSFYRFYFFINDYEELKNLNSFFYFYRKPIVLEIISNIQVNESFYSKIGFKPYKIYSRYRTDKKNKNFDTVKIANIGDIEEISKLINDTFDSLSDYIPSNDELIQLILKKEVYIIKVDNKLAGVSIYEKRDKNYYFRLSCVHQNHRPGLIGYMLASTSPQNGSNYFTWIDDNNFEAIKLNTFLGYKIDGTKNYIFVKNKEII